MNGLHLFLILGPSLWLLVSWIWSEYQKEKRGPDRRVRFSMCRDGEWGGWIIEEGLTGEPPHAGGLQWHQREGVTFLAEVGRQ